jgi:diguanylate cyclase (GGDEF)-like protein
VTLRSWPVARLTVGRKFALLLVVFVTTNIALAGVGLGAVTQQRAAAEELYHQAVHVRASADLVDTLDDAYEGTLLLIPANDAARQAELDRRMIEELAPRIERQIVRLRRLQTEPTAGQRLDVIQARWREFLALYRTGDFEVIGDTEERLQVNAALTRRTADIFEPVMAVADDMAQAEMEQVERARQYAVATQQRAWLTVGGLLAVAVAVGFGATVALIRSLVKRVRHYAEFADRVAGGESTRQLVLRGRDELTDLGRSLNDMVARQAAKRDNEDKQLDYISALQVAANEGEAHTLVKRHLERTIPQATAVVLSRNNSANRLQAATPLPVNSPLKPALADACPPASCMAVRLARQHERRPDTEPLLDCGLCGQLKRSTCRPLLVGGEVIGSVLLEHPESLTTEQGTRLRDGVSEAAPVLANLRNLAVAEFRASHDALTGVSNKRGLTDTLKRMVATATRTSTPMAGIMVDLDHFKQINDVHGHEKGDEVLAAVGAALRASLRESDFAGRYGGEEFLVLLAATDRDGARKVAETLRQSVARIQITGVDRPVTASLGVAVLPEHATDADTLIRLADRALYAAKRKGRNRVEFHDADTVNTAESGAPSESGEDGGSESSARPDFRRSEAHDGQGPVTSAFGAGVTDVTGML